MTSGTILLTAFEPFGGETVNASWEAARAVDGWRCGDAVAVAVRLSCAYHACVAEFVEAFDRLRPEAVLMTGQAAQRAIISVESVARSRSNASAPDNRGVLCAPAASDGPAGIETSALARPVARAIRHAGLAARVSTDAGGYVCNHLYYGALNYLSNEAPSTPAVFVHLPATPEQNPPRASSRRLATADAATALKAAMRAMTKEGAALAPPPSKHAGQAGLDSGRAPRKT
jgi:pyroglutamyl-peptidase